MVYYIDFIHLPSHLHQLNVNYGKLLKCCDDGSKLGWGRPPDSQSALAGDPAMAVAMSGCMWE
jgi:hypothetical protein